MDEIELAPVVTAFVTAHMPIYPPTSTGLSFGRVPFVFQGERWELSYRARDGVVEKVWPANYQEVSRAVRTH